MSTLANQAIKVRMMTMTAGFGNQNDAISITKSIMEDFEDVCAL